MEQVIVAEMHSCAWALVYHASLPQNSTCVNFVPAADLYFTATSWTATVSVPGRQMLTFDLTVNARFLSM